MDGKKSGGSTFRNPEESSSRYPVDSSVLRNKVRSVKAAILQQEGIRLFGLLCHSLLLL